LRRDVAFDGSWPKARLQEDEAGLWQRAYCILPQFWWAFGAGRQLV